MLYHSAAPNTDALYGRANAGGAAMSLGHRFQARVTSWWGIRVLLQTRQVKVFGLNDSTVATSVWCETTDSVDDVRVRFSDGHTLFGQCKRSLQISTRLNSEWASAWQQMAQEFDRFLMAPRGSLPPRLVLYYEANNSRIQVLAQLLDRFRAISPDELLTATTTNQEETRLVGQLNAVLDKLAQRAPNSYSLNEIQRRSEFLNHVYVRQLHLQPGEADFQEVVQSLQSLLLTDPNQAGAAVRTLKDWADNCMAERRGGTLSTLRELLRQAGIALRDSGDYQRDFETLERRTQNALDEAEDQGRLCIAGASRPIEREAAAALLRAVSPAETSGTISSLLVTGIAGAGKTGCLIWLARRLREQGRRVWYWPVSAAPRDTPNAIADEMGLRHEWEELFADALTGQGAILMIDGLDGIRDSAVAEGYERLIRLARRAGVPVVASIRVFDLRQSYVFAPLFPTVASPDLEPFRLADLTDVNHVYIADLTDAEMRQVVDQIPILEEVLAVSPPLREVVRNPFTLDLLCQLLQSGDSPAKLSAISTQIGVFDRYWQRRVLADQSRRYEREEILRNLIETMVRDRRLWADASQLNPAQRHEVDALLGLDLLRSHTTSTIASAARVEFRHQLLFDYAVERLFLPRHLDVLAQELEGFSGWGLFVLPSLRLFLTRLWQEDRSLFWETLASLEDQGNSSSAVRQIFKLPGYLTVVDEARAIADLQPLLDGCQNAELNDVTFLRVLFGVLSAVEWMVSAPTQLAASRRKLWLEFARDLIRTAQPRLMNAGRHLLPHAGSTQSLSLGEKIPINEAEVALLDAIIRQQIEVDFGCRYDVQRLYETMEANENDTETKAVMRRLMDNRELRRIGHIVAPPMAEAVESVWVRDPAFAVEIYDRLFSHHETDDSNVTMLHTLFAFQMSRNQLYDGAHWHLEQKFSAFLEAQPHYATEAMIRVLGHLHTQENRRPRQQDEVIEVPREDGSVERIRLDAGPWQEQFFTSSGHALDFLTHWCDFLIALPGKVESEQIWQEIAALVLTERTRPFVIRHLLEAAAQRPEFYVTRLWRLLTEPKTLMGRNTERAAARCLEAFGPYLSQEQLERVQNTILQAPETVTNFQGETLYLCSRWDKIYLLRSIPESRRSAQAQEILDSGPAEPSEVPSTVLNQSETTSTNGSPFTPAPHNRFGVRDGDMLDMVQRLHGLASDIKDTSQVEQALELSNEIEQQLAETTIESLGTQLMVRDEIISVLADVAASGYASQEPYRGRLMAYFLSLISPSTMEYLQKRIDAGNDASQTLHDLPPYNRQKAARGFIRLISNGAGLISDEERILSNLAEDRSTRVEVAERIWHLFEHQSDLVWQYLELWAGQIDGHEHTENAYVLAFQEFNRFAMLRAVDAERADRLLSTSVENALAAHSTLLLEPLGQRIACFAWWDNVTSAQSLLAEALSDIPGHIDLLKGAATVAVDIYLPSSPQRFAGSEQGESCEAQSVEVPPDIQQHAFDFLLRLIRTCRSAILNYAQASGTHNEHPPAGDGESDEQPQWTRTTIWLVEYLSNRIEGYVEDKTAQWALETPSIQQITLIWERVEPLMEELLSQPALPNRHIVYCLLKALRTIAAYDPRQSLRWASRVALHGTPWNAQGDYTIAQEGLGTLETIMSSLGSELGSSEQFCHALDLYLQAGHPAAHRLAFRFSAMFATNRG